MGFKDDLKVGEEAEMELLKILKSKYPSAYKETGRYCKEFYDLIIPKEKSQHEIKIEVKADIYISDNFAFECLGRKGKSTGIIKTSSFYWIQVRKNKYYIWTTTKLRRYLLDLGGFIRDCGDGKASAAWIVPEKKVLEECAPLAILTRKNKKLCKIIV